MGNCCQPNKSKELGEILKDVNIPEPVSLNSKTNSMIEQQPIKSTIVDQLLHLPKELPSKEEAKGKNTLLEGRGDKFVVNSSFATNSQHLSSVSHQETAFFSSTKQHPQAAANCSSFFQSMQPYKEKEVLSRIGEYKVKKTDQSISYKQFFVVTTIYTPYLSNQKIEIYKKFESTMESFGCRLITLEFASLSSPFLVTEENFQPYNFQIRIEDPLSLKFNALNQILKRLPDSWGWVALIDYDIEFENSQWVEETQQQLISNWAVQLFQESLSSPSCSEKVGLAYSINKSPINLTANFVAHSVEGGKAWAFRKDFFQKFGYFTDIFVTGFEETLFSLCLAGIASQIFQDHFSRDTLKLIQKLESAFQSRGNTQGYIKGRIITQRYKIQQSEYINILDSLQLLNKAINNLHTDSLSRIHVYGSQLQEELKQLSKILP